MRDFVHFIRLLLRGRNMAAFWLKSAYFQVNTFGYVFMRFGWGLCIRRAVPEFQGHGC